MAQSDASETVKEILRQLIRHRFWIAIGFASLFAVIAYFMGSGPVKALAQTEIGKIKQAESGVKAYVSTTKPTEHYKPIVVEKTEIMDKDVNKAWKELYDRQAPLLTWPDIVKDRIGKWGRKWPEDQDPGRVRLAIGDYIEAYPAYVDLVYKTFDPFNYETGQGVVASPTKEVLLRPAEFNMEKLPTLGTVWASQERLWIQRTMLEVIRQVNRQAKNWDSAIVKEITVLEVGAQEAQDQRSLAKGEQLTKAADILSPGQEAAAAASATDAGGGGAAGPAGSGGPMAARGEMMTSMMAAMGGMGGSRGGATRADEGIYFVTPAEDKGQYKILPVLITVLVDQDRVQDLLVELENSPMSIQVKDFELERPATQVTKPEKGESPMGMGMGMGQMMGMNGGMMMRMMGARGYGGMAAQAESMRMMSMNRPGMGSMAGMAAMGGMGLPARTAERQKVDARSINRAEDRKKQQEELEKRKGPTLFDPYFNIVQVTVYGQARFYNPPPAPAEAPASPGDATTSPGTPAAPGETPPAAAPAGAPAPAAPADNAKAAAPAPAEKGAAPDAKIAAPPAAEKGAPPAAGADAKAAAPPAAGAEAKAAGPAPAAAKAAEQPADAKPATARATGSPNPDGQGAAPKK